VNQSDTDPSELSPDSDTSPGMESPIELILKGVNAANKKLDDQGKVIERLDGRVSSIETQQKTIFEKLMQLDTRVTAIEKVDRRPAIVAYAALAISLLTLGAVVVMMLIMLGAVHPVQALVRW
jgi:hypothetical protein